jgi:hypothetical protein
MDVDRCANLLMLRGASFDPRDFPSVKRNQARRTVVSIFALCLLSLSAATARADLFGDLMKVARQAASAVFEQAGTAVEHASENAAAAGGGDPKPVQAGEQAKPAQGEQTPDDAQAEADTKAQLEFLKAQANLIDAIFDGKPLDAVNALIAGAGSQLDRLLRPGLAAVARPILPMKISPQERDASMQPPKVTVVNPGNFPGDLVYFVNGIDVSRDLALKQAEKLSARIERPVGLIYNVTGGLAADLTESTYDRTWPLVTPVVGRLIQANSTTRQVAHLIYHAKKQIAIVSHSQGCVIVRNALLMANTYTGGKAKDRVIWVATALPLRDEEICPKPARFRGITNRDDTVCQLIGLRLAPDKIDWNDACAAHDFATAYLNEIKPVDLR